MSNGNGRGPRGGDNVIDLSRFRNVNTRWVWWGGIALVAVLALFSSFYTIQPEEIGVVLRFGKFVRDSEPGLNIKLPLGMEQVRKVPIQRQLKQEFGFRTAEAGVRTRYSQSSFDDESLMLTGDLNIADVEWVVQYRVVDAQKYLFRVRNVTETFRAMSEAVMREVVGDRTVNEVLTIGRQEVATLAEERLQKLCDQYETGLHVEQVVLQNVTPPEPVKPSFNEVNEAQQEREEKINAAQSEYNREVPKARGQAKQLIEQSEGYAIDRVNRAQGDAERFNALFQAYRLAPEVTRTRIYLETMNEVIPKANDKIVIDASAKGILPLLDTHGTSTQMGGAAVSRGGAQ